MSFCILCNVVSFNYSEQNSLWGSILAAHGLYIVILSLVLILCTSLLPTKNIRYILAHRTISMHCILLCQRVNDTLIFVSFPTEAVTQPYQVLRKAIFCICG